tara:strand:- start:237 stop:449 length:213 start_codon:yes stop_codon:yes gene_type:complete
MKTINIAGIIILGLTVFSTDEKTDIPQVCIPVVEPGVEIEKEVVVVQSKPATDNFSRPRKPCPPSGPGRQ